MAPQKNSGLKPAKKMLYTKLMDKGRIRATRYMNADIIRDLGLTADLDWMVDRQSLRCIWESRLPTYPQLTAEFLCSVVSTNNSVRQPIISFHLGNHSHFIPRDEFFALFGLPCGGQSAVLDKKEASSFWYRLTNDNHYSSSQEKVTHCLHPAFRMIHRFWSNTIFSRTEGTGTMEKDDLLLLWGTLHDTPIDVSAKMLAKWFKIRDGQGPIIMGGLVSLLAVGLDIDLTVYDALPLVAEYDLSGLQNARMVRRSRTQYYQMNDRFTPELPLPLAPTYTVQHASIWLESLLAYLKTLSQLHVSTGALVGPSTTSAGQSSEGVASLGPSLGLDDEETVSDRKYIDRRFDRLEDLVNKCFGAIEDTLQRCIASQGHNHSRDDSPPPTPSSS